MLVALKTGEVFKDVKYIEFSENGDFILVLKNFVTIVVEKISVEKVSCAINDITYYG